MPKPKPKPTNEPKLYLKVVINKERTKVLFAEANADFINVLLSFLALPLGKVVSILGEQYGAARATYVGSLNTLYASIFNLDDSFFSFAGAKKMLINPRSSLGGECRKLALDITDSPPTNRYYVCPLETCRFFKEMNISIYPDLATCDCGRWLNKEIRVPESLESGDFITNPSSFVITDDLNVHPITQIVQILNNLGYIRTDTQGSQMQIVSFGINEMKGLLKLCLINSATPLTDMIIMKTGMSCCSSAKIPKTGISLHDHTHVRVREEYYSKCGKTVLKVCLQRSTNKLLFAVAKDEFVDLLFSFLTVPLGGVEYLLGGKTGLTNIDNLYRSVSDGSIDDKYFRTPETQSRLINPKLPHGYISCCRNDHDHDQFGLPLVEEAPPQLYWKLDWNRHRSSRLQYKFSKEKENNTSNLVNWFKLNRELYVKKETMCIVTDDLTISPTLATNLVMINRLGVPLSDVKEMDLQVGHKEALNILKASLTSKTALTDALIKPMLKQERKTKLSLVVT